MAHETTTRKAARTAYIREALPLSLIAARLNVAESTIARWKRDEGDWDKQRAAVRLTGSDGVHTDLMEDFILSWKAVHEELRGNTEISALTKVDALSRMSDAYTKTVAAGAKGDPKLNKLAVGMTVIEGFMQHVKAHHAANAAAILPALESFAPKLAELLA